MPSEKKLSRLSGSDLILQALGPKDHAAEAAWEEIVRRFHRRVFGIAYKFTGRYEEAEDLTQEIFLRLFRSLERFDRRADFGTWLNAISRNHCIDHYRSQHRERESRSPRDVSFDTVESKRFDPHRSLEARDNRLRLTQALDRLAPKLRQAVVLRDIHGLSYHEIARCLGVPEGTVKSRINRGRLELGRILLHEQKAGRV